MARVQRTDLKSYDEYIRDNDFEGAKARFENARSRWKNHWWDCLTEIYNTYKNWAKKYILDPVLKVVKKISQKGLAVANNALAGLYLLGTCEFNPFTSKKTFWVKIGKASDVLQRMRAYSCHNPAHLEIDFLSLPKNQIDRLEKECHRQLKEICENVASDSKEWFAVSEKFFHEIYNKKFNFFNLSLADCG